MSVIKDTPCPGCGYNLKGLPDQHRCPECGFVYDFSREPLTSPGFRGLNIFDKLCAVLAFIIALLFLLLGLIGLFFGCSANFTLPPVLGMLPALVGWGIIRSVIVAWRRPSVRAAVSGSPYIPNIYRDPIPRTVGDIDREIDRRGSEPNTR